VVVVVVVMVVSAVEARDWAQLIEGESTIINKCLFDCDAWSILDKFHTRENLRQLPEKLGLDITCSSHGSGPHNTLYFTKDHFCIAFDAQHST
jgi:hypothetical protein